jgi:hypothetical protein
MGTPFSGDGFSRFPFSHPNCLLLGSPLKNKVAAEHEQISIKQRKPCRPEFAWSDTLFVVVIAWAADT